jgi:hypothetical protein
MGRILKLNTTRGTDPYGQSSKWWPRPDNGSLYCGMPKWLLVPGKRGRIRSRGFVPPQVTSVHITNISVRPAARKWEVKLKKQTVNF